MSILMNKKWILGLALIMTVALAFTGCSSGSGGDDEDGDSGNAGNGGGSQTVVIAGSTSVQPLSEELAAAFEDANSNISIEVQGGGSGQGVKSIVDGIADLGALSRNVKDEEKESIAEEIVIAMDGVAVVVNPDCGVDDLTIDEICKIYTGEITNWNEVGGEDAAIVVVSREDGSGTRGAFTEITGVLAKDDSGEEIDNTTIDAIIQPSTGGVKTTVATTPNSIGYVSLGALDDTVKALKVEGVDATADAVISGDYKISRPFIYVAGPNLSEAAQAFIDFVLSDEGQTIVAEDFIPVK